MTAADAQEYLISRKATTEETPFGPEVLVYKVAGKMFATLGFDENDGHGRMNLKCDPDRSPDLRDKHHAIEPGYHMNKRHWNTLVLDGSLKPKLVKELIDHSWDLVVSGMTKKQRKMLLEE